MIEEQNGTICCSKFINKILKILKDQKLKDEKLYNLWTLTKKGDTAILIQSCGT